MEVLPQQNSFQHFYISIWVGVEVKVQAGEQKKSLATGEIKYMIHQQTL